MYDLARLMPGFQKLPNGMDGVNQGARKYHSGEQTDIRPRNEGWGCNVTVFKRDQREILGTLDAALEPPLRMAIAVPQLMLIYFQLLLRF